MFSAKPLQRHDVASLKCMTWFSGPKPCDSMQFKSLYVRLCFWFVLYS